MAAGHRALRSSRRQFVRGVAEVRLWAVILALLAGSSCLPLQTRQPAQVARIGYLTGASATAAMGWVEAFRQGLREHGYVEGQNLIIEDRYAEGQPERIPGLVRELVGLRVDAMLVSGDQAIRAAQEATRTIPIVMVACDAVASGLIGSLAHPGGNTTGVTCVASVIAGKRLELLKETVGQLTRAAVLWNADDPGKAIAWRETEAAAAALDVQLQALPVRHGGQIDEAFEAASRERADVMIVLAEGLMNANRKRLVELAPRHHLPKISDFREYAEEGALMTYGPNLNEMNRRDAYYVDRILKGTKPADLPVEQPTKYDFSINLKTAQVLGLTIPQHVLLQATEIVQ